MKVFTSQISYFLSNRNTRVNIKRLMRFLLGLVAIIVLYSVVFHYIMMYEGQNHSWMTGFYWTLTVMSTLGFGDITFTSDLGRFFSVWVLISGMISLLVLLPFTFIEFFYAPWLDAQTKARAPQELPPETKDHVIITHFNPVSAALIQKLKDYGYSYVVIQPELKEALELYDQGYDVLYGPIDDLETYTKARVNQASMVVAIGKDTVNSNICNTVRELDEDVKIVTTANSENSVDLLQMAGANEVLQMGELLGRTLSRRTLGQDARVHVVGRFKSLVIAEAMVTGTPLVGQKLKDSQLRQKMGLSVVGIWERGELINPTPDCVIHEQSVLLLAGSVEQLRAYDEMMAIYHQSDKPVMIIGAGRVGRGAAHEFDRRGMDYKIIDSNPERIKDDEHYVLGSGEDLHVLKKAGIDKTPCVLVTTHDDDTNIYLTIYVRRLRPDVQIISRSTLQRNVSTLHRAGADFVISYASMGGNIIFNILERNDVIMIAEGINVFNLETPKKLQGKTLITSDIRNETGCSILSIEKNNEQMINPDPDTEFTQGDEIVLIGTREGEQKFMEKFVL